MPPTTEHVAYQQQQGFGGKRGVHRYDNGHHALSAPDLNHVRGGTHCSEDSVKVARMGSESGATNGYISDEKKYRHEFFFKEPTLHTHRVFIRAAKIYSALKQDPNEGSPYLRRKQNGSTSIPPPVSDEEFKDDVEKRQTYELAFKTLKYQNILEMICEDSSFFAYHPEVKHDQALVTVMLSDFQNRKFQHRTPLEDEELDEVCLEVERAILTSKVKLSACLARHRIKARAPSIEFLLPEQVRQQEENNKYEMPVYMWVNQHKTNVTEVIERLKEDDFEQITGSLSELCGKTFISDYHCPDVLVFAPDAGQFLGEHRLVVGGHLVMQDKSSCLAPHSVKHLMMDDDDIVHVNVGSGLTTAHLSSLLKGTGAHIYAFGATSDSEAYRLHHNLDQLGAKNVRIMSEPFMDTDPEDSRFKSTRVVLLTTDCSKSGISNPVEFVISEGEDMKILRDLSQGESNMSKMGQFTSRHNLWLKQALKMPKVQAVVYMTRSVYEAENESVVMKAVEYMNMVQSKKAVPYRLVPPVLPFSADEIDNNEGIVGKFMKFKPSPKMNGCFVAVITREPEDKKEAARDIIARATAKGLLGKPAHHANGDGGERRSRRSPKRVRGTASAPSSVPSYAKQNGAVSSPVSSYIHASRSPTRPSHKSSMAIGARLHANNRLVSPPNAPKSQKTNGPAHTRVIQHPAPFR